MYKNLAMLLGMLCLDSGIVLASVVEVDLKNFLFNCESATCESLPGSDEMLNASFEWNTATGAPVPDTMAVNAVGTLGGFNYLTTNNPGATAPQFVFQDSSLDKIVISPCCQLPGDTGFFQLSEPILPKHSSYVDRPPTHVALEASLVSIS